MNRNRFTTNQTEPNRDHTEMGRNEKNTEMNKWAKTVNNFVVKIQIKASVFFRFGSVSDNAIKMLAFFVLCGSSFLFFVLFG